MSNDHFHFHGPGRARDTRTSQAMAADDEMHLALRFRRTGRLDEAEKAARKALRIRPDHPRAALLLSDLLEATGRHREARYFLREAARAHPRDLRLSYGLATSALILGELGECERAVRRVQDLLVRDRTLLQEQRRQLKQDLALLLVEVKRRRALRDAEAGAGRADQRPAAGAPGDALPTLPASAEASPPAPEVSPREPLASATVRFEEPAGAAEGPAPLPWAEDPWSDDLEERRLLLEAQTLSLVSQFEELLCLDSLAGVRRLEYQVETVRKILRRLGGRALLCDEVGLGKTIEAGMVVKEYLLRGLARRILILTPPGLAQQWREEMSSKFSLTFTSLADRREPAVPQDPELLIGSIAAARMERNRDALAAQEWDLVVVDEAHHLRRRSSRSWVLVNALRKRFVLLLSATPVHNDLQELYELVTLVRPGLLGTPAEFRRRFVAPGGARGLRDPEALRDALAEVMVRNTRSHADVVLPRRFATTLVLDPTSEEARAYRAASELASLTYTKDSPRARLLLRHLLGAAGSGPRAVARTARRWLEKDLAAREGDAPDAPGAEGRWEPPQEPEPDVSARPLLEEILAAASRECPSAKAERLVQMLAGAKDQVLVFCRYRATLLDLSERLVALGLDHAVYHGGLTPSEKDRAVEAFRSGARALLSSESGGEGRNVQFCRTIVNFDLPWDPMLIEQRIGRVHRIGQERDVYVFNFVLRGTLEEELLRLLEEKIHLFELVVGEVDSVLGHLDRGEDFADIVLDLWAGSSDEAQRRARFDAFGDELVRARAAYEKQKTLEGSLFADGLEV